MKTYTTALERYAATHFSDIGSISPDPAAERTKSAETLGKDLMNISTSNRGYLAVCIGMIVLLFIGSFLFVLVNLNHPGTIKAIFAICGISLTGLTKQMMSVWREKVHSDMVLVLARNLPADELRAIIQILLRHKEKKLFVSPQPDVVQLSPSSAAEPKRKS